MLDYEKEADTYDASRGGEARAEAATEAVLALIPARTGRLLDLGCGTGTVTRRLVAARPGLRVTGVDRARAMVRRSAALVPGAILRADCRQLPFPDATFDAVTSIWLLHLLTAPADRRAALAEIARVLRPGGTYVTTVGKARSHDVGSDIDAVLAPRTRPPAADAPDTVTAHATESGLIPSGEGHFVGVGQGRSPRTTITDLGRGWFSTLPPGAPQATRFAELLSRLPDQDRRRADPVFRLRAYRKPG
ncbi:class I SAM-dependent methyltransferase [Streptomyces sp. LaPpAH-108]|uniref:class I SAM-dependent methyltransferase n=1 Tax=Streptomyces sp. LaPpAH-108 TaxID=1155714 RepID=UPI0003649798|nr:class I SAM-dependent methyltransferase [Streptomyces sp. LaPpAH-108]